MMIYWDAKKNRVVIEMDWEEARDFANDLALSVFMNEYRDPFVKNLLEVAKKGAGF